MSTQLSIPQASKHFGVTPRTIHRWIQAGKVEAKKIDGQWSITADSSHDTVNDVAMDNNNDMILTLSGQCQLLESQLLAKDEQIPRRAKEIGAPMVASNRVGFSYNHFQAGGSIVVAEDGTTVAKANEDGDEEMIFANYSELKKK